MTESLPVGLYKGEDGVERYWDGSQWLEPTKSSNGLKVSRKKIAIGALVAVALSLSALGVMSVVQNQRETQAQEYFDTRAKKIKGFFQGVVSGCSASAGVEVDQRNLTIDGKGEEDYFGANYWDVVCIINDAGMPPAIKSRFDNTNSLQGLVEDQWSVLNEDAEVKASWSYHPNSGPSVALELESPFLEPFNYETHKDLVKVD